MDKTAPFREQVLTLLPKGGTGAEIGVWNGDFSARILDVAKPERLHLIDPFEVRNESEYAEAWYGTANVTDMSAMADSVVKRFAPDIADGRVVLHRTRSDVVLQSMPTASLDFVYVDGDHTFAAVEKDLALSFRCCRRGALICLDDYSVGGWWKDDVVRAANAFLGRHADSCQIVLCHGGQLVIGKR